MVRRSSCIRWHTMCHDLPCVCGKHSEVTIDLLTWYGGTFKRNLCYSCWRKWMAGELDV